MTLQEFVFELMQYNPLDDLDIIIDKKHVDLTDFTLSSKDGKVTLEYESRIKLL